MYHKKIFFGLIISLGFGMMNTHKASAQNTLFMQNSVASVYIIIAPDSLDAIFDDVYSDRYYTAKFVYYSGNTHDTVNNIGFRIKGNTSRNADKKGFKVSFNEFVAGQSYQNEKKINLNPEHNDPTMIRERLFYYCWAKAGFAPRQSSFVKLYINNQYKGLYTNIEEIDKNWVNDAYGNNGGNLYKCTLPADMVYLGAQQQLYKNINGGMNSRAYELKTNEAADDYTDLINLITVLNQPTNPDFATQIRQILNVNDYLKAYALDVLLGHWDGYAYNKNNYFLYKNTATNRFEYITYDTDNTIGIDWIGRDWATRNYRTWTISSQPRPLTKSLLAVPQFFGMYVHYIDSLSKYVTNPDSLYPIIDAYKQLIAPAAQADTYRTMDYGYNMTDFNNGFTTNNIDNHTPYGIKPFLAARYQNVQQQLDTTPFYSINSLVIAPNPIQNTIYLTPRQAIATNTTYKIYTIVGKTVAEGTLAEASISVDFLGNGYYILHLKNPSGTQMLRFIK